MDDGLHVNDADVVGSELTSGDLSISLATDASRERGRAVRELMKANLIAIRNNLL